MNGIISTIVWLLLLIGYSMLLLAYARFWRRRAGDVYYRAAIQSPYEQDKINNAMRSILAGNKDAARLYAIMLADRFSSHHPGKAFCLKGIVCVFSCYYYPKRFDEYLQPEQLQYIQDVLDFKDGKIPGTDFFQTGLNCLDPKPGTIVLFMPCSSESKYKTRFKGISEYIDTHCPNLVNGFDYMEYTGERAGLHLTKGRTKNRIPKNYNLTMNLRGKEIIIVDDLLTSGTSLAAFKEQIGRKGGKVTGAIFAAQTFKMPLMIVIRIHALINYCMQKKKMIDTVFPS